VQPKNNDQNIVKKVETSPLHSDVDEVGASQSQSLDISILNIPSPT
jgi:hypothetical protein